MHKKILLLSSLLVGLLLFSQTSENDILGTWMALDHSVAVAVFKSNGDFRARVVWFDEKLGSGKPMNSRHDVANPNPALRSRKILGMEVLENLQYNPHTASWENGRIYDATTGRHWDSAAKIDSSGILRVRGYWKFKWIGKTMSFKRLK